MDSTNYAHIWKVADELTAKDEKPTLTAIRNVVGGIGNAARDFAA